eukprot:COSAG06_NODE_24839_length_651_cov_1.119565_1_plen_76_part_10
MLMDSGPCSSGSGTSTDSYILGLRNTIVTGRLLSWINLIWSSKGIAVVRVPLTAVRMTPGVRRLFDAGLSGVIFSA